MFQKILSLAEVGGDFGHASHLIDVERAAVVAVTASDAGRCLYCELGVMVGGKRVAHASQVVIFVHKPHIDVPWARLAMIAIHAHAFNFARCERAYHRVVAFFGCGIAETEDVVKVVNPTHTPGSTVSTPGLSKAYCRHW